MYHLFFFAIGLACIVMSILLLRDGESITTGIGVLLIGIANVLKHGSEIVGGSNGKDFSDRQP